MRPRQSRAHACSVVSRESERLRSFSSCTACASLAAPSVDSLIERASALARVDRASVTLGWSDEAEVSGGEGNASAGSVAGAAAGAAMGAAAGTSAYVLAGALGENAAALESSADPSASGGLITRGTLTPNGSKRCCHCPGSNGRSRSTPLFGLKRAATSSRISSGVGAWCPLRSVAVTAGGTHGAAN